MGDSVRSKIVEEVEHSKVIEGNISMWFSHNRETLGERLFSSSLTSSTIILSATTLTIVSWICGDDIVQAATLSTIVPEKREESQILEEAIPGRFDLFLVLSLTLDAKWKTIQRKF